MKRQLLYFSKSAEKKLVSILKDTGNQHLFFFVKGGGCNGFEYRFEPRKTIENKANLVTQGDLSVEVCDSSILFTLGTKVDWKSDIMGEAFVFNNPMAQNSCGCGSSFSPK